MSRIGRLPINIPSGVTVKIDNGNFVTVKGPKGTLTQTFHPDMTIEQKNHRFFRIDGAAGRRPSGSIFF
jgi:large subunit ribosomal protein L6